MSGRTNFLANQLKQIAVLWTDPVNDGYGGRTFADPIEIDVRWEDKQQKYGNYQGEEVISTAVVFTDQSIEPGSFLLLGEIADLPSDYANPLTVSGAQEVGACTNIPSLDNTMNMYQVFLSKT